MPKQNKQRGRREKRKRETEQEEIPSKRPRPEDEERDVEFIRLDSSEALPRKEAYSHEEEQAPGGIERPFYGLLEDDEQEYFRHADEMLERNDPDDFPTEEDRAIFIKSIYKRAEDQELKIANSQSCSRLMEKLILLSTPDQKKKLFEKFSGNFMHLIQHRFASHCCETLFVHSAPIVTEELMADSVEAPRTETDGDEIFVSMENLFLYTLNELEGQMGHLLTDRYASHALRVLLIVLSGKPLAETTTKSLVQSKKKERIGVTGFSAAPTELSLAARTVPESFQMAVSKIISDTVASLDTSFIRVLATHPTGNPTLQLLLELELSQQGKSKAAAADNSIISKLLPDDVGVEGSESATFVNGLIYEPIGSRLLETIVVYAPGKLFKQIYRTTFKDRIGSLARNEIASFVVIKVLERLSKDDLEEAVTLILPQISGLIERNRTTVIKTLLERCQARKAFKSTEALTTAISESYGNDSSSLLLKMTQFVPPPAPTEETPNPITPRPTPEATHGSLLAQTMLTIPNPASSKMVQDSLLALPSSTLLSFAIQTHTSHILQTALQPTETNLAFRRKLINSIISSTSGEQPGILTLALSKPGSHTLDALFTATSGPLFVLKERIIATLASHESLLRDSDSGRVVWRNWMGTLFLKNRTEWIKRCKAGEGGAGTGAVVGVAKIEAMQDAGTGVNPQSGVGGKGVMPKGKNGASTGKTAIELAREKFAANKASGGGAVGTTQKIGKGKPFRPTGANAGLVQSR